MRLSRATPLAVLALAATALPTPARAAVDTPVPSSTLTAAVAAAKQRTDCGRTRQSGSGATTLRYTAPVTGLYSFRLDGGDTEDWDLAVFNAGARRAVSGSAAFGATETARAVMYAGSSIDVQVCRISGTRSALPVSVTGVTLDPKAIMPKEVRSSLVHIETPTKGVWELVQSLGIETDEAAGPKGVDAIAELPQLDLLRKAGIDFEVEVADMAAKERADRAAELRAEGDSSLPSGRTTYRMYEDYQAELKQLVTDNPGLVKPVTLPKKTFQGRDTTGVEISGNVDATDDQKPVSFIMGVHHAREWPAGEIPMEFALYLARDYGKDERVTKLLDTTRVVVVPLVNGDGYIASRTVPVDPADTLGDPAGAPSLAEGALIPLGGTLAYRRKNCNGAIPSADVPCTLQLGVDPNRNYGFKWGGKGASTSPNSQSYRGTGPWSETETQAVHEYSQVRNVTSLLTIHTVAALVLRPPGLSDDGQAPDEAPLKALGDKMAADTGYTSQYSFELYDTSGTTEDWNYGAVGTFGYTIELGAPGGGFHEAYQGGVIDQWTGADAEKGKGLGMRSAMLRLAEAATDTAQFSTVTGRAPAGRTLRLRKTFQTSTSPICTIAGPIDVRNDAYACVSTTDPQLVDDKLDYTTKVPDSGKFTWLVTPSTRPFELKAGRTEQWTLTCENGGKVEQTEMVTIGRGETKTFTLPCGGTIPSDAPTGGVKDKLAPQSTFRKGKKLKATRSGVLLNGTSKDRAPKGLSPVVKKVSVSLGRRVGKLCRFARANGTFGPKVSCLRTTYLPAKGTRTWSFVYRHKLPKGRYLAWVRGVDAAGNTERKAKKRNLVTFTIR